MITLEFLVLTYKKGAISGTPKNSSSKNKNTFPEGVQNIPKQPVCNKKETISNLISFIQD